MGLRGSLRFAPFLLVLAGLIAAFFAVPAGGGLANPADVDRRNLCSGVDSRVCGQVCFYSNCVECNRVEDFVDCNRCVQYKVDYICGSYECNCREECDNWDRWCEPNDPDDPGAGQTCWSQCSGYTRHCDVCDDWCVRWDTRCRIEQTFFRDWHNAYPGDLPSTPTPWDDAEDICARLPQGVFGPGKRPADPDDSSGPLHSRLRYWRDGDECVEWTWHVMGNSRQFQGRHIPIDRGTVSNIEPALVISSGELPQYTCREDTGRGAGGREVYSTPDSPDLGPLTGGVFGTPPVTLSYTPEPQRANLPELPGDEGGPRIYGLDVADPSGPIGVNFDIRSGSYPAGAPLYARYWTYTGREPRTEEVAFAGFVYDASSAPELVMGADTLGVYSFQVAYRDGGGEFVKSNVLSAAVGFDAERAAPNPTLDGPHLTPVADLVALPAPTRLPTLTPGGSRTSRPAAPVVRRVSEYGGRTGDVRVVFRGGFSGKLEYRYWNYVGVRPSEEDVEWRSYTLPAGRSSFVVPERLAAPAFFVFEFRAVDASGVRGDPSPYFYTWVGEAASSDPAPTVDWVAGPSDVTPPKPAQATPPLDPAPDVVTPTAAPGG